MTHSETYDPKVLYLDHSGELGGAELYLIDVLQRLDGKSEVIVFQSGAFPDRLKQVGIHYSVIKSGARFLNVDRQGGWMSAVASLPAIAQLVLRVVRKASKYDVMFANSQKALVVGGPASLIAGKPLIWNLHDILTSRHFGSLNRMVAVLWSNLFASHVITNSYATLEAYRNAGGRAPASVVYNGINSELFEEVRTRDVEKTRNDLKLGEGPVVGIFSRLAEWKGQHVLLESLRKAPEWKALVVGGALFQEDQSYEEFLKDYVKNHDIEDRVHFLGFRDDVPRLMKAVDAVVHSSIAPEPFGRVVVEGMLAEKPVIATACGGPIEIVDHMESGLLVEPGNSDELAEMLTYLNENPDEATRLAVQGAMRAKSCFSLQKMCDRIEAVIRRVS